ncbi:MAG TPA: hypothetical protein VJS64_00120 [Pyrinomonadaceae bacterium]|nr:hypothetical protein [Pyrinomonadaceae bacterium]
MNKFFLSVFTVLLLAVPTIAVTQHGFSVKEYEEFHEVLHPLEHEALPKNDFARIRKQSSTLINHGREIVKLGVPDGTAADQQAEFKKELAKFNSALNKFRGHARRGSNSQLKTSYSAVHDSFEMLASMLPRR